MPGAVRGERPGVESQRPAGEMRFVGRIRPGGQVIGVRRRMGREILRGARQQEHSQVVEGD